MRRVLQRAVDGRRQLRAPVPLAPRLAGSPPTPATWVDNNELQIMTGRCWTELRRPLRAVPVLESALNEYGNNHARDKALYLTWLAVAYLEAGEPEQAADVLFQALELSGDVNSARPQQRIDLGVRLLADYSTLPGV